MQKIKRNLVKNLHNSKKSITFAVGFEKGLGFKADTSCEIGSAVFLKVK